MFTTLFNFFFGCTHRNTTFPFSARSNGAVRNHHNHAAYVVCLDCGKEFPYSWEEMRILPEPKESATGVAEQVRSFSITK
jgi:Fe2+ or Zn2+ uptake regulation protein